MPINIIDNFATFKNVKENWNSVYEADPQAHFFLSWIWLSKWLQMVYEPWFILAAKLDSCDSSYVAFFPLKIILDREDEDGFFHTEICMAGNSMADYTGLICLPDYEEEIISEFAAYIRQQLVWSSFEIQNVLETDTRMSLFLKNFSRDCFEFSQSRFQNPGEDTDHYIAPYVSLTDDWERYLQNNVSANTRQKIRRFLRKLESSDEFYITYADEDNLESHIEILLRFWELKWRDEKGDDCNAILDYVGTILRHCFEHECLYLPVFWKGNRPLGAIANFVDVRQKSMLFFITGRDRNFKNPPPGLILHADAIRYAIQNGFKVYDFLRGNERYKYSFGVKERSLLHVTVKYKNRQDRQLDLRGLPLLFQSTVKQHQANRLEEAEGGYSQILEIDSNHPEALYGLGVLMRQKREYPTAENLFNQLLQVRPNSIKALFGLGILYQTQGQLSKAIEAYNRVLVLEPKAIAAYNNLGDILERQGQLENAIACYQKALELDSNCVEADVNLGNILHAQGKLSPDKQIHYAELNYKLGLTQKKAGDFQTAKIYFQKALELNPNYRETDKNLREIYENRQQLKVAKTAEPKKVKAI